ncbi:hypothetical protein ACFSL6_27590 [Paenibacillus thailandensis]|uniref:hypothetical protein n=1 Tax=Paenibacillus thailandensis TaxID=393250 RepID=UPI00363969B4
MPEYRDSFEMLKGLYGEEATETVALERSYRSTRPIVEFTSRMIAGGERIIPFNREGEKPSLTAAGGRDRTIEADCGTAARA